MCKTMQQGASNGGPWYWAPYVGTLPLPTAKICAKTMQKQCKIPGKEPQALLLPNLVNSPQ